MPCWGGMATWSHMPRAFISATNVSSAALTVTHECKPTQHQRDATQHQRGASVRHVHGPRVSSNRTGLTVSKLGGQRVRQIAVVIEPAKLQH